MPMLGTYGHTTETCEVATGINPLIRIQHGYYHADISATRFRISAGKATAPEIPALTLQDAQQQ